MYIHYKYKENKVLAVIQIAIRIIYYIIPLFFAFPCYFYALISRKKRIKKVGEEKYVKGLEKWVNVLQAIFVIEAFLIIFHIALYGVGEGIVGVFHLALLFLARTICFTYIEGYKRGIMGEKK